MISATNAEMPDDSNWGPIASPLKAKSKTSYIPRISKGTFRKSVWHLQKLKLPSIDRLVIKNIVIKTEVSRVTIFIVTWSFYRQGGFVFGRQIVWYFVATRKTSAMRDTPHVRHGILIRWECWPTAKRPQRFLNTRRKCLASVPASFRNWGWSLSCTGSKEGATSKRYHKRSSVSISS